MNLQPSIFSPRATPGRSGSSRGFTLIEVLVVAVVIVLMLGMALPVFRTITGSRSEAGATNIIASMLGRARSDAIGIQQPYGVAFLYNTSTQQTSLAEVYFPPLQLLVTGTNVPGYGFGYYPTPANALSYTTYFYNSSNAPVAFTGSAAAPITACQGPPVELVPDTDLVPLPAGIGVQTVCNCSYSGSNRVSDGYLLQGVILFDGSGRIISSPYGIAGSSKLARATGNAAASYPSAIVGTWNYSVSHLTQLGVSSQFGLVIYQRDAWLTQKSGNGDALYIDNTGPSHSLADYNTGSPSQQQEENWLDQNSTPLLIDRYTGTLIRAE